MLRVSLFLVLVGCGRIGFETSSTSDGSSDATPDPSSIAEVAPGGLDTCARTHGGDLYCWGYGQSGHHGDGLGVTRPTPGRVPVSFAFSAFDINDAGVCAIAADESTYCWGLNASGSLGIGHGSITYSPTLVVSPQGIEEIALGSSSSCVLDGSAVVSCAGRADLLGTMASMDHATYQPIPGLSGVAQLSSGDNFTCALLAAGNVMCWGANDFGQLGDGSMTPRSVPVAGPAGPYVQISTGDQFTCARGTSGTVDCWGRNDEGQLGDTTLTTRGTAAPVLGITDAIDIATGSYTTCALHATGKVSCWGDNGYGSIGDGTEGGFRPVPSPAAISDVIDIAARTSRHICAVTRTRDVYCWGDNGNSQIGDSSFGAHVLVPARVTVL